MDQDPQHLRPSEASGIDLGVFRDAVGNLRRVGDGNNFQIFRLFFVRPAAKIGKYCCVRGKCVLWENYNTWKGIR